ncbi:MAG: hypothetical protein JO263_00740 [Candidatus Eremiobacteraeota bacterium]|nr:hypothetical protein [Candidatus Eremiobacteraeota bacterium]
MGKIIDALEEARSNAQALHSKLTTVKDHAAIRANARVVAGDAAALVRSVHKLTDSQRTDAKHHLHDAASALEAASKEAHEAAAAPDAQLKEKNAAMRARVRKAVQLLSLAVAAKRAHERLVKA